MPIYSYKCLSCNDIFEELILSISKVEEEEKDLKCPKCQSINKKRLIGSPLISFKGNGWTIKENRDSTGSIKNQSEIVKSDLKNIKSSDIYQNTNIPIDKG